MNTKKDERRRNVIKRLKAQLKAGTKPVPKTNLTEPLTEKDKQRIEKELVTLEARV